MGRRRNNPELVQELMDEHWTMDQDEYEKKFDSLSSGDKGRVSEFIDEMGRAWLNGQIDPFDDDDEIEDW